MREAISVKETTMANYSRWNDRHQEAAPRRRRRDPYRDRAGPRPRPAHLRPAHRGQSHPARARRADGHHPVGHLPARGRRGSTQSHRHPRQGRHRARPTPHRFVPGEGPREPQGRRSGRLTGRARRSHLEPCGSCSERPPLDWSGAGWCQPNAMVRRRNAQCPSTVSSTVPAGTGVHRLV